MASRRLHPAQAATAREMTLSGMVVIGGSGAVSAQTPSKFTTATVTKDSGSGRYIVTLDRTYKRCFGAGCQMVGPDSAAFPTTTGSDPQTRTVNHDTPINLFRVQFKRTDTQADADPASGSKFTWWIKVSLI